MLFRTRMVTHHDNPGHLTTLFTTGAEKQLFSRYF